MSAVAVGKSLSEARQAAAEGFLRWICEYDGANGPNSVGYYLSDPDFVPVEPKWLRNRLEQHLEGRLTAMWDRED